MMSPVERRRASRREVRTADHIERIDAHLRAWVGAGVAFALLARDLAVDEVVLRDRALRLGLRARAI